MLKAKSGWNPNKKDKPGVNETDDFGFSALPGGHRDDDGFHEVGERDVGGRPQKANETPR